MDSINQKINNKTDKEEISSLKDKEILKKTKFKKIRLQKINLNTQPININTTRYEIIEYYNLNPNKISRKKILAIIAVIIIVAFISFMILTGKFHHQINDE